MPPVLVYHSAPYQTLPHHTQVLPARLAVPWVTASKVVGMPPVLVYATYNLLNWRRFDPNGPVELGNITCLNVSCCFASLLGVVCAAWEEGRMVQSHQRVTRWCLHNNYLQQERVRGSWGRGGSISDAPRPTWRPWARNTPPSHVPTPAHCFLGGPDEEHPPSPHAHTHTELPGRPGRGAPPPPHMPTPIQNFLGGPDEEHFRLVHVEIEARAGPAIAALRPMQAAAEAGDAEGVLLGLRAITAALQAMQASLARMGEKCDPYIYYHR